MSAEYKGFTLNVPGDEPPWSQKEYDLHKNLVDTIVLDCVNQTIDTTNGHQHYRLWESDGGSARLTISAAGVSTFTGNIALGDDIAIVFGASSDWEIDQDSTTNDLRIRGATTGQNVRFTTGQSGHIVMELGASSAVIIGAEPTSLPGGVSNVLCIQNGVVSTTPQPDYVKISSVDLSAGNTMLSVRTEGTSSGTGTDDNTSDGWIAIDYNGATHYILTKATQPT